MTDTSEAQATPQFAHLHLHTHYSLVDGTIKIPDLLKKVKELGHTHVAITDHSNMFGAVDFYSQCKKQGITPIVGCDLLTTGEDKTRELAKELKDESINIGSFHLVLLARNKRGYHKLAKIVSDGYLKVEPGTTPIVPVETLKDPVYANDIVALSSSKLGELPYLVTKIKSLSPGEDLSFDKAHSEHLCAAIEALETHLETIHNMVGKDNYYVELTDNKLPGQRELMADLAKTAKHYELPLVATADAHYLEKDFADTHALAVAIKNNLTETDIRNRRQGTEFHLLNNEEFTERFKDYPAAISNTLEIAKKCSDIEIQMGVYHLPPFELGTGETEEEGLRRIAKEGLEKRLVVLKDMYGDKLTEEKIKTYWERLEYELGVIVSMGFPGYFLIVQDFIQWSKQQDIPVGPGRGSGAGSLVAYALTITDIDPLPYDLIFERFLNPERVSMPDFDIDFCQWRREEVIQYVTKRYGKENVAQITTYGKLMAKGAVKSVGRAMGMGFMRVDNFTKLFPDELNISLQDALDKEPKLHEEMDKDDSIAQAVREALKLEGLNSHLSVHAAGVIISDGPMTNFVPVYTVDGEVLVTQYEMKKSEAVGLVKFDFLGLKTLTVVKKAVDLIKVQKDPNLNIDTIPMNDKSVYDMVSTGNTVGIFQCESTGMMQLIKKLKPDCFEDIIALVALFRPGPLGSGMVDDFVERKHGRQEVTYTHPNLEPILNNTQGLVLYQEQVQRIAVVLANYTLGEADLLRRAMGKKIAEEMEKQKARFLSGATENGIDTEISEAIFDNMAEFAKYGFNKSHSAAYGLVSYQTAYLKTHYPEQFMAAIMTCDLNDTKKLVRYIEDSQRMGIKILPPDINRSELEFDVPEDKGVVGFGLSAIKGMGESSVAPLIEEREKSGSFKSLKDLADRINLNKVGKKTLELLAQVGALDEFGYSRTTLVKMVKDIVAYSQNIHEAKSQGQKSIFDFAAPAEDGADLQGPAPWEEKFSKLSEGQKPYDLEGLALEKKLLGVFLTGHPMEFFKEETKLFSTTAINNLEAIAPGKGKRGKTPVTLVCYLTEQFQRRAKSGKLISSIKVDDGFGSIEAMMFEKDILAHEIPPSNTPVVAIGAVDMGYDGDRLRLTLERVYPISTIREERVGEIEFTIKSDSAKNALSAEDASKLSNFSNIIKSQQAGNTKIKLKLEYSQATVSMLTTNYKIELNDSFLNGVRELGISGLSYEMRQRPKSTQHQGDNRNNMMPPPPGY
jgi:DNA polymerase-3 subunit alpha